MPLQNKRPASGAIFQFNLLKNLLSLLVNHWLQLFNINQQTLAEAGTKRPQQHDRTPADLLPDELCMAQGAKSHWHRQIA